MKEKLSQPETYKGLSCATHGFWQQESLLGIISDPESAILCLTKLPVVLLVDFL